MSARLSRAPHAAEQDEARLGELHGALEVDDAERGPEVPVRLAARSRTPAACPSGGPRRCRSRRHRPARSRRGCWARSSAGRACRRSTAPSCASSAGDLLVDVADLLPWRLSASSRLPSFMSAPIALEASLRCACSASVSPISLRRSSSSARNASTSHVASRDRHRLADGVGVLADEAGVEHGEGLPVGRRPALQASAEDRFAEYSRGTRAGPAMPVAGPAMPGTR